MTARSPPVNGSSSTADAPASRSDAARAAFDAHAADYGARWERDPVARRQRARVRETLARVVPASSRVLDLGCGTGVDAAFLAGLGHTVTGVDVSEGMLDVARTATAGLDVRLVRADVGRPEEWPDGMFDAAVSNFGALNCVDLPVVADALAGRLAPGAPFVLVLLAHWSPLERVWLGRRREAATVAGRDVPVRFWTPEEVRDALRAFTIVERTSLGLVLPPPGGRGRGAWLDPVDRVLGRLPLLRRWGDHVVYVAVRAGGGP